jgi:hypothetical protein
MNIGAWQAPFPDLRDRFCGNAAEETLVCSQHHGRSTSGSPSRHSARIRRGRRGCCWIGSAQTQLSLNELCLGEATSSHERRAVSMR